MGQIVAIVRLSGGSLEMELHCAETAILTHSDTIKALHVRVLHKAQDLVIMIAPLTNVVEANDTNS